MIPTLFEIPLPFGLGSIPLHSFGMSMVLAFIAGWKLLVLNLRRAGEEELLAEQMVTWAAIGGILGARLLYIISFPEGLLSDPIGTIFSGAGFVYYGGFIGGTVAVCILLRRKGKSIPRYADIVAPTLAIGYAVGRIGCQLSGDGDYGMPSTLPWAIGYPLGVIPTPPGVTVHPAPLYETLMALALCFVLSSEWSRKRFRAGGQLFGVYLLGAALARFAVEAIRIEPVIAFSLTQAQLTAIGIFAVGLVLVSRPARV
jgi:phosphatidylglycerol:prolipoprotein diacylglycerol transferase